MSSPHALYIWTDKAGTGRNRYALFRRTFSLLGPKTGQLHIFADTRYRLIINGHTIGHGPARFVVSNPEYDTYDLTPYLRTGRNAIAIMANSYGCVTLHNQLSVGGLIVWGEAHDKTGRVVKFNTDDAWRVIESTGHRQETPCLSGALNPAESLDARRMPIGWESTDFDDRQWPFAIPCRRQDHWGPLQPRSIPLLDERAVWPRRRLGTFAARGNPNEQIYSSIVITESGKGPFTNARVALWTHIHSPIAQEITLGAWRGRYWINGQPLESIQPQDINLRREFLAKLHAGWNNLFVYDSLQSDWWNFYLAIPKKAGLELSAERHIDSDHTFLIGGPWEDELADEADQMPLPLATSGELPERLGGWKPWPREHTADTPSRERAWKRFERIDDETSLRVDVPAYAERVGDDTLSLLFDFGREVLGRPVLDFEAAEGTVVDLTYSGRLKADGTPDIHARLPVDMAERYITRKGRQQWHVFHPRGLRYLELLIKGNLRAFQLHQVAITRANYPAANTGSFECSDPTLNEIWAMGPKTLHARMEDVYLSCPEHERALDLGDLLPQFFANLACSGDLKLFRRCIDLFLCAQGEGGVLTHGAHGLSAGTGLEHSAIIPQAIWHDWAYTGDTAFLNHMFPRLKRLMKRLESLRLEKSQLLDASQLPPHLNLSHIQKGGAECAVNCLCQRAFFDAARIMYLIGKLELGRAYADRARNLAEAIRREFWDDTRGVFVDRTRSDVPEPQPSLPANALPIVYDIATKEQTARMVPWMIQAAMSSFQMPGLQPSPDGLVTPYVSFCVLEALYREGRAAEAEQYIRMHWGRMLDRSGGTCRPDWAGEALGNRCRLWSACPTHYLSTQVLGVSFPEPGNLRRVLIRPQPGTLAWAQGTYPHPDGQIRITWQWKAGRLSLHYEVPPTVEVITRLPKM